MLVLTEAYFGQMCIFLQVCAWVDLNVWVVFIKFGLVSLCMMYVCVCGMQTATRAQIYWRKHTAKSRSGQINHLSVCLQLQPLSKLPLDAKLLWENKMFLLGFNASFTNFLQSFQICIFWFVSKFDFSIMLLIYDRILIPVAFFVKLSLYFVVKKNTVVCKPWTGASSMQSCHIIGRNHK